MVHTKCNRLLLLSISVLSILHIGSSISCNNYDTRCCQGNWITVEDGEICQCWSSQIFGPQCDHECRTDLCNGRGICGPQSNPQVHQDGSITGTCICDQLSPNINCVINTTSITNITFPDGPILPTGSTDTTTIDFSTEPLLSKYNLIIVGSLTSAMICVMVIALVLFCRTSTREIYPAVTPRMMYRKDATTSLSSNYSEIDLTDELNIAAEVVNHIADRDSD